MNRVHRNILVWIDGNDLYTCYSTDWLSAWKLNCKNAHLNWCDFVEVLCIWYTKAPHPMLVTPFFKMSFKSTTPPITVVPTYLALKFLKCISYYLVIKILRDRKNPINNKSLTFFLSQWSYLMQHCQPAKEYR
jgi:hypothetical protein